MNAKHQFKYTYNEGCEDFSPVEVTFDIPGEVTLSQMLYNFQSYLKACGFVFDGELEIVDHTFDVMKDQDDIDEIYGCMADFDKECGCLGDSIAPKEYQEQRLKEWNEGIAKLDKEVKEEREIREKASLRADELKQMEERWKKVSDKEKASILTEVLKASGIEEVKKNNWVHGMCNPPSPDWAKGNVGHDGAASVNPKKYSKWLNVNKKK